MKNKMIFKIFSGVGCAGIGAGTTLAATGDAGGVIVAIMAAAVVVLSEMVKRIPEPPAREEGDDEWN